MTRHSVESERVADGTVYVFVDGHEVFTVPNDDVLREFGQALVTMADRRQGRIR
jgi:hypothetical protein